MPRVGQEFNLNVLYARFDCFTSDSGDRVITRTRLRKPSDAWSTVQTIAPHLVRGNPGRLVHGDQYRKQTGEERLTRTEQK